MPLSKLNKEQFVAATAKPGNNLVIASAGTGKTSTIVARIAYLLQNGIKPEKILLLTFTNKAASEMIGRLDKYFDKKLVSKITAGTFHSVCYTLLKRMDKGVTLKPPSELKIFLKSIYENRNFTLISDEKPYTSTYLYDILSLYQNKELKKNFYDWFCENYPNQACFADVYNDILLEFEEEKAKFNYVDFNDLLIKMRRELKTTNLISFDEILVDEYQDTNMLQNSLIDSFKTKSLFCVGDFDQSIYAFNGANIEIIASFKQRYKNSIIHTLNINYRSSPQILEIANRVIEKNPRLYEKKLLVSRSGNFLEPKILIFKDCMQQYNEIAKIISNSKYPKEDIAIIFRNNSSADGCEIALKNYNINSKRVDSTSFFEIAEIKAVINIISIILNPKDIMAFINILNYAKGVGEAISKEIFENLSILGDGNIVKGILNPNNAEIFNKKKVKNRQLGLFDDIDIFDNNDNLKNDCNEKFRTNPILNFSKLNKNGVQILNHMFELFDKIQDDIESVEILETIKNSKLFDLIADSIATKRAIINNNGSLNKEKFIQSQKSIFNKINLLIQMSKSYKTISLFYSFITLGVKELQKGEGVNLMSIHASKGLEFNLVFIVDLAQNRFPNIKLMKQGGSIEEERRLFYVGVTRAKDELYLSYAIKDFKNKIYKQSQFLIEAGLMSE